MQDGHKLAYLGGLFDGEGFISLRATGLKVGVQMGDLSPLEVMCEQFGGNIRSIPKRGKRKSLYELSYGSTKAARVLKDLLPYLIGKKDRVILTLEYYKNWAILSLAGRMGLISRFDNEELVKGYRKYKATGRPIGSKTIEHHKVVKQGYAKDVTPFLL